MFTSSYKTVGDLDNLSIKYSNLYSINGDITYVTTDPTTVLPTVNKWTNTYGWKPTVKFFDNQNDIYIFFSTFQNVETIDLGLLGDSLWYGNVGHALFDGLYPVYLASVKFGCETTPFVYLTDEWHNTKVTANEGVLLFSGNEVRSYRNLGDNKLIHFKNLISGTGRTGNRVINEEYTIYGSNYNGMETFKNRMLFSCGAVPDRQVNSVLKIVVINNKRYSMSEKCEIQKVIEHYKTASAVDICFLDWSEYPSFKEQMQIIQDVDIHVTGPGTGMIYMPFLKKGAVNINLGYMEHTQTNGARPNIKINNSPHRDHIFPGWLEQSLCAGTRYVSTLYYDRFKNNEILSKPLIDIIDKAINLVNTKQILKNNHAIDAEVFIEYCKRSSNARKLCDHLTNIAFFIEMFVHEHPAAISPEFVDITLLRQIKDEFRFDRRYEIKL